MIASSSTQRRPRQKRGFIKHEPIKYGHSVLGAPLLYFPANAPHPTSGLIIAGTHGDETASIALLSAALRTLPNEQLAQHVVLSINPDGNQLGTRSNANGVDLNRNFPSQNWSNAGTIYRWNSHATERDVFLKSGVAKASEPETSALIALINTLQPAFVVSFHEPLGCIDCNQALPLAEHLAATFNLPRVEDVGYATPGSFGTWCDEQSIANITLELPPISVDEVTERYLSATLALLTLPAQA